MCKDFSTSSLKFFQVLRMQIAGQNQGWRQWGLVGGGIFPTVKWGARASSTKWLSTTTWRIRVMNTHCLFKSLSVCGGVPAMVSSEGRAGGGGGGAGKLTSPAALQVLKISHFFPAPPPPPPLLTFCLFALFKAKKLPQFSLSNIFLCFSLALLCGNR